MIHDVRIFDGEGNLKKVIPGNILSQKHWAKFEKNKGLTGEQKLKNAREKWKLPALKKRKIRSRWVQKPITCLICGVKFMPVNPKNTLCSPQCKRENQRQYDEKKKVAKAKYMREYRKSE